jgi:hypothetical protein
MLMPLQPDIGDQYFASSSKYLAAGRLDHFGR